MIATRTEKPVEVFDLVRRSGALPAKLEELVPLSFIGSAAVKFYKAKVEAMRQLGVAEDQRKATLGDGQDAGECLLRIEARIGELAKDVRPAYAKPTPKGGKTPSEEPSKYERMNLPMARVKSAQQIHSHPEAVERVIQEARENEDIPTRTAVLKQIQIDRVKELQKDKIPENERIHGVLGEEEFAEWSAWARIRVNIKRRMALDRMSAAAQREIRKIISGIDSDLAEITGGK